MKTNLPFTEEELRDLVSSERQDAVGFDNDNDELLGAREKALSITRAMSKTCPG